MKKSLWDRLRDVLNLGRTKRADPEQTRYVWVPVSHAGVHVDHESAMTFSAVFRAVSYISQTIACLPWHVIRQFGMNKRRIDHPASMLIDSRPNPEMSAFDFREIMTAWALTWGNGVAEIERDGAGRPLALWPVAPDRVTILRDRETYELIYRITNYLGGYTYLGSSDVFHLHGLGYDGIRGYSVISLAARSIGVSIAAEQCAEDFFANGAITSGALRHPRQLSNEAKDRMRADLESITKGSGKRWRIPIFEENMEWIGMSMPLRDAQMLEQRKFAVTEIARWFGLPPHKLADLERATFSNIESQAREVVNDALMPWVRRYEHEADYKLFSGREHGSVYTELDLRGMLRGDDQARAQYYKVMREIGVYSTNDIRILEDMDPVGSEGDALIMQTSYTTLERIVSGEAQQKQLPAQEPKPKQVPAAMIQDAFIRILKRETGQFDQVRHKLDGDYRQFDQWAKRFFGKHRGYMFDILNPLALTLSDAIRPDLVPNGELTGTLDACINDHIERSTLALFDLFDGRPVMDIERRAKDESRRLIESITSAVLSMEKER